MALENIQFSLQEGETLGIVGKTGAGKTTILKLLMREYDQYQGTISLENITLKLHIRCIDGCNGVRATGPFSFP